jgi:hypothetical protein
MAETPAKAEVVALALRNPPGQGTPGHQRSPAAKREPTPPPTSSRMAFDAIGAVCVNPSFNKAGLRAHLRRGSITQGECPTIRAWPMASCWPGGLYDCLREVAGVGMNDG